MNRRGFAGFVSCRQCGEVVGCPHCSVALKPHMAGDRVSYLMCHYCGYKMPMPDKCPECGSPYISSFGIGTEQVEQMVKKDFRRQRFLEWMPIRQQEKMPIRIYLKIFRRRCGYSYRDADDS